MGEGSTAGGPPAGAVVVPMEAAAPAAAAGARPAWTTRVSTRVTWAGAAAAPPPAGAAAAGALVAAPAAAVAAAAWAPPPVAWTRLSARLALAAALFLLGCAAAGLGFFTMIFTPGKACTALTDDDVADLRTASEYLLLAGSAQVLAATMALLVPARPVAFFGSLLGWLTAYRATDVLVLLVASCHGNRAHGALSFHIYLFFIVQLAALLVGVGVSIR